MATLNMNTVLVVGSTSGIGEAFARRFHSMGKKVIITGRRQDRLDALQAELTGLETYNMDIADLSRLPNHVETLFKEHPAIDTVFFNAGIQYASNVKDMASTTDAKVIEEVAVNVTAPMIFARHCIPLLLAQKDKQTTLMITSSGLGFVPVGSLFPVYSSTKAAIHAYCVGIRQALHGTNVSILEIVPPFVGGTNLGLEHRDLVKGLTPMPLRDFTNDIFAVLESTKAEELKEVTAGTAAPRVEAWRSSIGKILDQGLGG